jgi:hypothetical protein
MKKVRSVKFAEADVAATPAVQLRPKRAGAPAPFANRKSVRFEFENDASGSSASELHKFPAPAGSTWAYDNTVMPCYFRVRKEAFAPGETLDNDTAIDLIFQQIAADVMSKRGRHPRIMEKEEADMTKHFEKKGIMGGSKSTTLAEKEAIIDLAKNWSQYFGRRHAVQLLDNTDTNVSYVLTVGHQGVLLSADTRVLVVQTGEWRIQSTTISKVNYTDLSLETMRGNKPTEFMLPSGDKKGTLLTLKCLDSHTILQEVEGYLMILEKDARWVLSTAAYNVRDATLLSFPKDVVIALSSSKSEKGWLFGTYDGKTGQFPIEYVTAILGPPTQAAVENARKNKGQKVGRRGSLRVSDLSCLAPDVICLSLFLSTNLMGRGCTVLVVFEGFGVCGASFLTSLSACLVPRLPSFNIIHQPKIGTWFYSRCFFLILAGGIGMLPFICPCTSLSHTHALSHTHCLSLFPPLSLSLLHFHLHSIP